ncbi:MAG: hypothetical protein EUB_03908 [Eubacterium sp.]|uniref:hypothetical protein n=1 Tax=Eubacterium sp. TaxID=142586 RepID=UPI003034C0B5
MDAVEYLKQKKRMTKDCKTGCDNCPSTYTKTGQTCINFQYDHPEKAVAIVEEWAKEHPAKTYKSVFLEKFPDAMLSEHGEVDFCVQYVFGKKVKPKACGNCRCAYCWNREVEE